MTKNKLKEVLEELYSCIEDGKLLLAFPTASKPLKIIVNMVNEHNPFEIDSELSKLLLFKKDPTNTEFNIFSLEGELLYTVSHSSPYSSIHKDIEEKVLSEFKIVTDINDIVFKSRIDDIEDAYKTYSFISAYGEMKILTYKELVNTTHDIININGEISEGVTFLVKPTEIEHPDVNEGSTLLCEFTIDDSTSFGTFSFYNTEGNLVYDIKSDEKLPVRIHDRIKAIEEFFIDMLGSFKLATEMD